MALQFRTTLRNALLNAIRDALDAGAGAAILAIYSGTPPATVETALAGNTLLAKLAFPDPIAPDAAGGVLTLDCDPDIEDLLADATGVATFFRLYSSADGATISEANAQVQGTVTNEGGGGDLELVTTSIVQNQPVRITTWTITAPGA